jgi:tRNA (guanine-N7-)-methyltransferase
LLDVSTLEKPVSWYSIFGKHLSVELEIGTGKGHFLTARAARRPDVAFMGIERSEKWARHAALRVEKAGLPNVRIVHAEALWFLEEFVPAASVRAVHIYFPDPWPKRRHEKRRLWGTTFVEELLRVLAGEGHIHIATDVKFYFVTIQQTLSAVPSLEQVPVPRLWPTTGYGRKYLSLGRPVFEARFVRAHPGACSNGPNASI